MHIEPTRETVTGMSTQPCGCDLPQHTCARHQVEAVTEPWRRLQKGDRVLVVSGIGETEKALIGCRLVFQRFAQPHGYAVCVQDSGQIYFLHPEALRPVVA